MFEDIERDLNELTDILKNRIMNLANQSNEEFASLALAGIINPNYIPSILNVALAMHFGELMETYDSPKEALAALKGSDFEI